MTPKRRTAAANGRRLFACTATVAIGLSAGWTRAVDLEWNNFSVGLLFYDTSTNWNPVNAPDDADNVLFAADQTLTLIIGAPSNGNNFTVTATDHAGNVKRTKLRVELVR